MIAATLLTIHNLRFFHVLLARIRAAVVAGSLGALREQVLERMSARANSGDADAR
jgi:queuine/archaeosine tRNA-ribosyltransferase